MDAYGQGGGGRKDGRREHERYRQEKEARVGWVVVCDHLYFVNCCMSGRAETGVRILCVCVWGGVGWGGGCCSIGDNGN